MQCLEDNLNVAVVVVVDVQMEVSLTVTHSFKRRPQALKATGAVEVVRMEAVAADLGEAAEVQPKWKFSREKLCHALRIQRLILEFHQPWCWRCPPAGYASTKDRE